MILNSTINEPNLNFQKNFFLILNSTDLRSPDKISELFQIDLPFGIERVYIIDVKGR